MYVNKKKNKKKKKSFKQKLFGFLVAIRDYKAAKEQEQILVYSAF